MTACREFAKWSLQSSASMREKFFLFIFYFFGTMRQKLNSLVWLPHHALGTSKRTGTTHRVGNTASTKERDRKP